MKTLLLTFVCIFLAKISSAQSDLLSFDEHNKYIYYQVVDIPGVAVDTLHVRGLSFLKANYAKMKVKAAGQNNLAGQGKFLVYGGVSVLKHEKGEIDYTLNIEFKDQKYRYWLTDFTFTPYERDRYNNYVPKQGVVIPLETADSKLDKKDAAGYVDETGAFCKQFGDSLKQFILHIPVSAPKKEENAKKVVTDKW
jgi:hypothetical protein